METLETGDIFFFYRPRVEERSPEALEDVQNFAVVLRPRGDGPLRMLIIGRKRLPDIDDTEPLWGFVRRVSSDSEELRADLEPERYETKTRGERFQPGSRPAGEGGYAIVRRGRDVFLAYRLERPQETGDVQQELNIAPEAMYVFSVKNPRASAPPQAGLPPEQRADYPIPLQEEFDGRRWLPADPIELIDHEGAEILLIGAREDVEDVEDVAPLESLDEAEVADVLGLDRDTHPLEPLFRGEWA